MKEKYSSSKLIGQTTTVKGFLTLLRQHKPDAAIVDVAITWKAGGLDFVEEIKEIHPYLELHLISPHPLDESVRNHLEKHAERILNRNISEFIDKDAFISLPLPEVDKD